MSVQREAFLDACKTIERLNEDIAQLERQAEEDRAALRALEEALPCWCNPELTCAGCETILNHAAAIARAQAPPPRGTK